MTEVYKIIHAARQQIVLFTFSHSILELVGINTELLHSRTKTNKRRPVYTVCALAELIATKCYGGGLLNLD